VLVFDFYKATEYIQNEIFVVYIVEI
jgi:hypothetical protein